MNNSLPKVLFAVLISFLSISMISAQSDINVKNSYNTKRNSIALNWSIGGGDYPFQALGLTLSRQFFNGETLAGIAVQYIGNTAISNYVDPVQVFPVMLDVRLKFMESPDGRIAAFIVAGAGYVVSITNNGMDEFGPYEYKNGWGIYPGVALRFNVFKNVGIMIDGTWFHHAHPQIWLGPIDKVETKHWNTGMFKVNVFF